MESTPLERWDVSAARYHLAVVRAVGPAYAGKLQCLDTYDLVFVHEASGQLVEMVLALAGGYIKG